jgi:hypothetical protein
LYFHCRRCCHRRHLIACTPLCADMSANRHADTTPTQRPASRHGAMSPTWSVSCRRHGADMSAPTSFWGEKIPDTTPTFPAKISSGGGRGTPKPPSPRVASTSRVVASRRTRFVCLVVRLFVPLVGCCVVSLPLVVASRPVSLPCHVVPLHLVSCRPSCHRRVVTSSCLVLPR